jgi:hypothetical protein
VMNSPSNADATKKVKRNFFMLLSFAVEKVVFRSRNPGNNVTMHQGSYVAQAGMVLSVRFGFSKQLSKYGLAN